EVSSMIDGGARSGATRHCDLARPVARGEQIVIGVQERFAGHTAIESLEDGAARCLAHASVEWFVGEQTGEPVSQCCDVPHLSQVPVMPIADDAVWSTASR